MNDQSLKTCPECGNRLSANLPAGLCAACLMRAGLESNSGPTAEFSDECVEQAGSQIGPYKLLEQIGEGGFGIVFMAEQLEPVRRRVALKVIKPGMDSRQIVARFEAERQALAMMDHENIARVLDAGTSENGRPYFVMELVRGIPITEYCDRGKLLPHARLELMISVCRAIQHAHQKGIIHRDIKPSNVLVTLYDGRPVPKVIDFGVAKAIQQPLTDKTMFTRFGQVMGTLEYMSPEQAEMSGLDIDTRGDIYSLGVLMYELLTGSTPINRERLKTAAIDEVLRLIRDEEPERPSLRLDHSGDAKQTISSMRGMAPEKLGWLLQGELDWIVMKALEKDRSRRYGTANDFASDIQRFLDNEPIVAAPPSTAYRFRKFVAKNRAAVAFAATLTSVVLIGLLTSIALYIRSENLRSLADQSASRLAEESDRLAKALKEAEAERSAKSAALLDREHALRERTDALRQSNALRLAAESSLQLPKNPGLALRLAHEALRLEPKTGEANSSLINAVNNCHEIKTTFFDNQIHDAGFSDNGRLAAVRMEDDIEIWDLKEANRITSIRTRGSLNTVLMKFSPDGSKLAVLTSGCSIFTNADGIRTVTTDRVVRLFDSRTGNELHVLRGHEDRVVSVEFSRDTSRLLTGSWDGTARVWNAHNGSLIRVLDYDENQSSLSKNDVTKIQHEMTQHEGSVLSIGRATFYADSNQIHLEPLRGRSESVFGFYGNSSFKIHEFDPRLDALDPNVRFTGGGGGVGGWSTTSIKPGTQVFSVDSGEYLETLKFVPNDRRKRPPLEATIVDKEISIVENGLFPVEIARLKGHRNQVVNAAVGPDGRYVFSAGRNSIRIWQTKSLSFSGPLVGHERFIRCIDISDDGHYVATGSADGTVRVWSSDNRELLTTLRQSYDFVEPRNQANLHQDVLDVQFDRAGKRLLTLSSDRAVLEMSDDGKIELNVRPVNVVRVWDWKRENLVRGWQRQRRFHMSKPHDYNYESVAFSDEDTSVVAVDGLENGQIRATENGRLLNVGSITGLVTTRDSSGVRIGPRLALRSWRIAGGNSNFEAIPDLIGAKAFLCRDGSVAIIQTTQQCQVIDTASGRQIGALPSDLFVDQRQLIFSKSGKYIFVFPQVIQPDGYFGEIWDLNTCAKVADLKGSESLHVESSEANKITCAMFDAHDSHVAISLRSGWVVMWDMKSRKLSSFRAHSEQINRIEFSLDGQLLATASSDRTARIWIVKTLKKYLELGPHESEVTSVAFSPNHDFVVTISKEPEAVVWPLSPLLALKKIASDYPVELPRPLTLQEQEQFGIE